MIRTAALVLASLLSLPALAEGQAPRAQPETLFSGDLEHGGYGALRFGWSRVNGKDSAMVGVEGGWIINHSFILGLGAVGLASPHPAFGALAGQGDLMFGYGGLLLGYTLASDRLVHGTATLLVGGGSLGVRDPNLRWESGTHDALFVVEPMAMVELNVAAYFRVGLGASFRFVGAVDTQGVTSGDLRGLAGTLLLKFGKF